MTKIQYYKIKVFITVVEYQTGKGDWQKYLLFILISHSEKSASTNYDKNKNKMK